MIVGPYDVINRFRYWVLRIAQGGDVLAPGDPDQPMQLIDARDIAEWILRCADQRTVGPFNVIGPITGRPPGPNNSPLPMTRGEMLKTIRQATGSDARVIWADEAFLEANEVGAEELPYNLPSRENGFFRRSLARAAAAGLTTRPLLETATDTWGWLRSNPVLPEKPGMKIRGGMDPEREAVLLEKLRTRAI